MKKQSRILLTCAAVNLAFLISILILNKLDLLISVDFFSVLSGNLFALINLTLGVLSIKIGINKSDKVFFAALWGGVLIRLMLMIILVIISLKFLEFNTFKFIFSLLFFYFFNLFCEILYLNSRKN